MLTLDQAVEVVVKAVNNVQGCKSTELVCCEEITSLYKNGESFDNWAQAVQTAVNRELLVEIEYVLPEMEYRTKAFLLPAGTQTWVIAASCNRKTQQK